MVREENNGKRLKATKWQVGGTVAVALLTAYVTWQSNRSASDADLKVTIAKHEAIVKELNLIIIPEIQRNFESLTQDYKELAKDESAARERIAKLEGILEAVLRKVKKEEIVLEVRPKKEPSTLTKILGMTKKKKEKKSKLKKIKIPKIRLQEQRLLKPSLNGPIHKE